MTFEWIGAEGEHSGMPLFLRVRDVPVASSAREVFPHLLVLTWAFDVHDPSGLPTTDDYRKISQYEESVLEPFEALGMGLVVGVRTHNGVVRYLHYVRSIEDAAEFIESHNQQLASPQLAGVEHDAWREYGKLVGSLDFGDVSA